MIHDVYGNRAHFIEWWAEEHGGKRPPSTKVVCPYCDGHGVSTRYLGSYTESDRAEMGDEWYEFAEDWASGMYDRVCPECEGRNVVDEFCGEAAEAWAEWERDAYDDYATRRAESGYQW